MKEAFHPEESLEPSVEHEIDPASLGSTTKFFEKGKVVRVIRQLGGTKVEAVYDPETGKVTSQTKTTHPENEESRALAQEVEDLIKHMNTHPEEYQEAA